MYQDTYRDSYLYRHYMPAYSRVTARTSTSVIDLAELKAQLYLFEETQYDAFLNRVLIAGQELAENYIGEYLSATTVASYYPDFRDVLTLPNQFVDTVTSVIATLADGTTETVDSSRYILDESNTLASVNLRRSQFSQWTSSELSRDVDNPVAVTYTTSVPTAQYDELVRHAVILYCASMFRDRENYLVNGTVNYLPMAAERLLAPLKRRVV